MILGAALLVLVALGLFAGGIATGATALYWSCVAVSAVAAVLLVLAWREGAGRRPVPEVGRDDDEAQLPDRDDVVAGRATGTPADAGSVTDGAAPQRPARQTMDDDEAPAEEVEVTDLLLVMDLHAEVLVVDEHPRFHLPDCTWLRGRTAIPLPVDEARTDGFTPCGICMPDRHLAAAERERRARKGAS